MKIVSKEIYAKSVLEMSMLSSNEYLLKPISEDEAKNKKINMYINMDWHYVIGNEEVNFIFLKADTCSEQSRKVG